MPFAKEANTELEGDSAVVPVLFGVESHWASAYASATARQVLLWLKMVDVAIPILLYHGRRP
jgi:hypothetical protein